MKPPNPIGYVPSKLVTYLKSSNFEIFNAKFASSNFFRFSGICRNVPKLEKLGWFSVYFVVYNELNLYIRRIYRII